MNAPLTREIARDLERCPELVAAIEIVGGPRKGYRFTVAGITNPDTFTTPAAALAAALWCFEHDRTPT